MAIDEHDALVTASVVCVGDAFVDLVIRIGALPGRGGAAWCGAWQRYGGGTAGNVASGLARLGIPTTFVGRVGDDENGRFLANTLAADGVGLDGLATDPEAATGVVVALVEPDGQWTFVVAALGAAHTRLTAKDLGWIESRAPSAIFITGVVLLEEPGRGVVLDLARHIAATSRMYFDSNIAQAEPSQNEAVIAAIREVADLSSVVCVGEGELAALSLRPRAGQTYVVKRGARGATVMSFDGPSVSIAPHRVEVADVIGAGDAFDAAFIAAELRGYPPEEALKVANAAAALSVTRPGGRSMPPWADVKALADGGTA